MAGEHIIMVFSKKSVKEELEKAQTAHKEAEWTLTKYLAYENGDALGAYFRARDAASKLKFSGESASKFRDRLFAYVETEKRVRELMADESRLAGDVKCLEMMEEYFDWGKQFGVSVDEDGPDWDEIEAEAKVAGKAAAALLAGWMKKLDDEIAAGGTKAKVAHAVSDKKKAEYLLAKMRE